MSKMASQQENTFCVLHFEVPRSVITVQREFRARFRKDAPCRNNITRWYRQFVETGCLCKGKSPGRPRVSDGRIERVREAFLRSPRKSVARASRELDMPKMTVWKVLRKRLCFKPYKMRLVQALTPADKVKRRDFCEEMQLKLEDNDFVERLIFCDEATFHISGKVNVHNVRIWGTEQLHAQIEHRHDSPKINVFCAVSRKKVHSPFFFPDATVTGDSFLDMLENWLLPQLNTNYDDYILQLDSAPTHFHRNVRVLLNCVLQQHWIGRAAKGDSHLLPWPPRSLDLTPCSFFLWGFVKDSVYIPTLPMSLRELRDRITHALLTITADMLH